MTSTSFRPSPSSRSSSTFLRSDPANPRRIREEDLDTRERSLRHWESVQPVPALRAAVPAVSPAGESDSDILKMALDLWGDDLVGPAAAS
jgi:hypothetical protein